MSVHSSPLQPTTPANAVQFDFDDPRGLVVSHLAVCGVADTLQIGALTGCSIKQVSYLTRQLANDGYLSVTTFPTIDGAVFSLSPLTATKLNAPCVTPQHDAGEVARLIATGWLLIKYAEIWDHWMGWNDLRKIHQQAPEERSWPAIPDSLAWSSEKNGNGKSDIVAFEVNLDAALNDRSVRFFHDCFQHRAEIFPSTSLLIAIFVTATDSQADQLMNAAGKVIVEERGKRIELWRANSWQRFIFKPIELVIDGYDY